jgi:EamA-like transporter family
VGSRTDQRWPRSWVRWECRHRAFSWPCPKCRRARRRSIGANRAPVQSYLTIVVSAAVAALIGGTLWGGVSLIPGWAPTGWLVLTAICGQVLGWLLVALGSPSLRVEVSSALLLLTPIGALVLAAAVLAQMPSPLQVVGCVLILGSAYCITTGHTGGRPTQAGRGHDASLSSRDRRSVRASFRCRQGLLVRRGPPVDGVKRLCLGPVMRRKLLWLHRCHIS